MPISNYPKGFAHGVNIRGLPILNTYSGNVFWVDSNGGSDQNKGTFDRPFATWDYAVGKCTANNGDMILLKAGHSETISSAAEIDLDVAGVTTRGLGDGADQPTITFSNSAATVEVNADSIVIDNVHFQASVTGITIGIDVKDGADDGRMFNCRFSAEALTTDEFTDALFITTSDRWEIAHCTFDMDQAGAASAIHFVGACLGANVHDNFITGDYSVACIEGVTAAAEQLWIHDNTLVNGVHGGLNTVACISLFTGTTGHIQRNYLYTNVATPDLSVVADGCFLIDNWYSETAAGAAEPLYTPRTPDSTYNFIGVDDSNNAAATTNVAANEDGSILERLEQIQEAINKGTGTALASNTSIVDYVTGVGPSAAGVAGFGTKVTKSSAVLTADDDLFTVTGKCLITLVHGEMVTAETGATTSLTVKLNTKTAGIDICAASAVISDSAGTLYMVTGDQDDALNGGDAPTVSHAQLGDANGIMPFIVDGDTIESTVSIGGGTPTGTLTWDLFYIPLESGASVAAAA